MFVVIPIYTPEGVQAGLKGDGMCPHLSLEGTKATCGVHDKPEYEGSPCWTYGNSEVDTDFISKRGKPCRVGLAVLKGGGLPAFKTYLKKAEVELTHEPWRDT
jgi:hypothetical protein